MEYLSEGVAAVPGHEPHAAPTPARTIDFAYAGRGAEYFWILFVNWVLTLVTVGLYYPWARARELRYVIGSLVADGDPFTFHGNGRELFRGFLRAWVLFVLPLYGLYFVIHLVRLELALRLFRLLGFYLLLFAFVSFAIIGSLRYRSSRTTWRGIRFGFDGTFGEFGQGYLARMLALFFSLGLAYPHVATWRRAYMVSHARLGTERMGFDGAARQLFPSFLICWLLILPTLGMSLAWFHGHQQAYYWNHTMLAGGRFRSSLTGGQWLRISLLNGLLVAITLGLAAPFAYNNLHREFFARLALDGADIARIRAVESAGSGLGEGTAGALDADAGVDIG